MSYKPQISSPFFRPRNAPHGTPMQTCIVCGINDNGTINLITFGHDCQPTSIMGAVCVQADADGCPCHFTEAEPVPAEPPHQEPPVHK